MIMKLSQFGQIRMIFLSCTKHEFPVCMAQKYICASSMQALININCTNGFFV